MPFLNAQDAEVIRRRFAADLDSPVKLLLFLPATGGLALPGEDWQIAEYTRQILKEVAELSDKIQVEEYGLLSHGDVAQRYNVRLVPAIVFLGREDYGVRYLGLPAGYEFVTLLETIIAVSRGRGEVSEATRSVLAALPAAAHLQIFVTPT
ncbi:MAG: glutaredoxin-like protein domain-containing protein [Armatimonadetes bacterium CSP1-3]|nr:MAG: glutaredoxin-like protein domain-containing protein [Armatimonadetes bacterium CSP1-3]